MFLCSCPPAAAHHKLGETTGTCCLLAGRQLHARTVMTKQAPGEHWQPAGLGELVQGRQQVQALDPAPASLPALYSVWHLGGWHLSPASPPFSSQQSISNKARGAESPVSSPASGRPPERRHIADAVVAMHSYRFGARSHRVPLELTDRHCKHFQEGTLPTACTDNIFPNGCSETCTERQANG